MLAGVQGSALRLDLEYACSVYHAAFLFPVFRVQGFLLAIAVRI